MGLACWRGDLRGLSHTAKTDEQILDFWNTGIEAREDVMAAYDHVAVEISMGKPQLTCEERSTQWVPRGDIVKGSFLGVMAATLTTSS